MSEGGGRRILEGVGIGGNRWVERGNGVSDRVRHVARADILHAIRQVGRYYLQGV